MHRALLLLAVLLLSINHSEPAAAQNTLPNDRLETARQLYEQGLALMEVRELERAAERFQQALQFEPEFAEAYAALGRTYFKMREWQKAVDNLNRAAVLKAKQREASKAAPDASVTQTTASRPKRVETSQQHTRSLSWKNAEIVSSNELTASTINLRNLLPQATESSNKKQTTPPPLQTTKTEQPIISAPEVLPTAITEETTLTQIYRVGANDVLDVRLNDGAEPQSISYAVTATGLLEHPLLNEPMSVAGLTVEEIAARIDADLRRRAILENARTLVGVKDYASHPVLVSGLVKESGTKFLRREAIPLYVVVADAQPLPEAAKVTVVRGGERSQLYDIELNRVADMDFLVRPGDVITLRPNPTQFIYIGGEIKSPGEKPFRRGLTLMQVVVASGGLDPKAKIAEIANNNDEGFLVSTRFKLKDIVDGKVADPMLKPGDRISILR